MTTLEEALGELKAAKRAPLIATVAVALLYVACFVSAEEGRVPLSMVGIFVGLLWVAMFGISMRRLKLAAQLVEAVEDGEA